MILVFAMKGLSGWVGAVGDVLAEVARLRREAHRNYPWLATDA